MKERVNGSSGMQSLDMCPVISTHDQVRLKPQWLSGRVLNFRSKGCWFETNWRHCIVSLSKALYPLLSTGSTQDDGKFFQNEKY